MKLCWSTLYVKDLDESLKFYQEIVGLKLNKRFKADNHLEIAFLGEGETQIELICDKKKKDIFIGDAVSLGFLVDSVEKKMEYLKEKDIKITSQIIQPNPYSKFFFINDPNGMKIQFFEDLQG